MNLKKESEEIRKVLKEKRKLFNLKFVEENHIYFMNDKNGNIKDDFPSVTNVIKNFYEEFDSEAKSLEMSKGDLKRQRQLLSEWKNAGDKSVNLGSRVHYFLEEESLKKFGIKKKLREPFFECDQEQLIVSEQMIEGGKKYLELMKERGAMLVDTEMVLGHPELGFTGQTDKTWIIENKEKDGFGFIITDWKSNKEKNFKEHWYTTKMRYPFSEYPNTALTHYLLQLPLYGKLLIKMLEGTKYENIKLLGSVVVRLTEDGNYEEYRVPTDISSIILDNNFNPLIY